MANNLEVLREGAVIATFDIDESTVFVDKLQGERTITCPVASRIALDLQEGDYVIHKSEVYVINNLPDFEKEGSALQKKYNITFEAEFYFLLDTFVINDMQQKEFPKFGSALEHLQLIFDNANRNDTGWTVGEVADTQGELINYNWTYVRTALNEIAETFKLEWSFTGRTIRMVSTIGSDTGLTFEVGRGKGLHQIKRSKDTGKSVVTRVFGVGGSRNIDHTYRGGVERSLIFEGRYVETAGVTAGTERVKEGKYTNEEIYPRFNGVVGSVVVNRDTEGLIASVTIVDSAIDFNINDHLQEGVKAKVHFRTGSLTGSEYEIASYNPGTKAIELIPVADTNGYVLPNDLNLPEIGDKFTLLDMRMPAAYIAAAELELRNESLQYLEDNRRSRLLFGAKPDQRHLRANNIRLKVGDRATVIEADAQVNEILRFTEISYPLVNEFDVTAVIGNEIRYDRVVKLFADTIQTRKDVQTIDRRSVELAKRGVQNLRALELSVFDVEGNFDSSKLNVGVVTALLGIYGTKSQSFRLSGVYITDNYAFDKSKVLISGGTLIHQEFTNPGAGGNIWVMTSKLTEGMVDSSLYYVYARCSKLSQVGSWVVTTDQIKPEDEAGYYHFLTGVVYPVLDGYRNSDFTNGIADINGNRLKIGRVVSRDGLTGFDLDAGEIFGRIVFRAAGGGLKNVTDVDAAALSAVSLATTAQGIADAALTSAGNANSTVAALAAGLGGMAYEDAVELAKLGSSIVEGGYIKADLIEISTLIVRGNLETAAGAQAKANAAQAAAEAAAAAQLAGLVIGGRNLVLNSKVGYETNSYNYLDTIYNDNSELLGKEITVSFDLETTSGNDFQFYSANLTRLQYIKRSIISFTGKQRIVFTTILEDNLTSNPYKLRFETYSYNEITYKVSNIKIERGNKATDWTPAPEDAILAAQQAADAAEAAAIAYAAAQDTLTATQAAAYADGVVDIEEARAIADATAKLAEAKADATTKANAAQSAAISSAAADAQIKADNAKTASETAAKAYADAQDALKATEAAAYADGVVSDEEAARIAADAATVASAAADASAKAEAARIAAELAASLDATAKVAGIKVGGRNFFKTTTNLQDNGGMAGIQHVNGVSPVGWNVTNGIYSVGTQDNGGNGSVRLNGVINSDGYWTISGYIRSNSIVNFAIDFNDVYVKNVYYDKFNESNPWMYFEATLDVQNYTSEGYKFIDFSSIPWVYFCLQDIKVEKGNKATDWSPAPEDLIADAQAKADAAQSAAQTYAAAQAAYEREVAKAYADGIVDVEEARAIAEALATLNAAKADATAKAEAARIAAEAAAGTDATTKANAAQAAAIASANATAESIAQSKADIAQANAISLAASDATGKANAARIAAEAASNAYASTAASSAASAAEISAAADASNKATAAYNNAVGVAASAQATLTASLKSLAYEDVVEVAKLGSTVITGGKLKTNLLDADYIKANIVNASYIYALDIVARTLAATTGTIGGWQITSAGIKDETGGGYLMSNIANGGGGYTKATVGLIASSASNPESPGSFSAYIAGRFESKSMRGGASSNIGIHAEASGAYSQNVAVRAVAGNNGDGSKGTAIYADGDIQTVGLGSLYIDGQGTINGALTVNGGIDFIGGVYMLRNVPLSSSLGVNVNQSLALRVVTQGVYTGRIVLG